ncbi:hypothetical protein KJ815_05285, partial [bacterium]|nr:hypothetical protein [bacterium]
GSPASIQWTRQSADGPATLAVNRNYPGGAWETITDTVTTSSYVWSATGPGTSTARMRVSLNSNPNIKDESNGGFTITQPALSLTSPDGGETVTLGGPLTVRWTRTAASGNVTVRLNRSYPGGAWETLTTSATADTFAWTATGAAATACRVKIQLTADTTISDLSASNFELVSRSVTLTSHDGGETYYTGSFSSVTFARTNATGNVTVQLNRNYPGGSWETLTTVASASSYSWSVGGSATQNARLRVFLTAESYVGDTSNANFAIAAPSLLVSLPNGGESWPISSAQTISWQRFGVTENVKVELNRSYPEGSWVSLSTSASGSSLPWTVSGPATDRARVRVTSTANSSICDTSNANFTIVQQSITLLTPQTGETLKIGFPHVIRWSRVSAPGNATVQVNRTWPSGSWETLGTTAADSLIWNVTSPVSNSARVRVALVSDPSLADTSDGNFTIFLPSLSLISPAGGERWRRNTPQTVSWTRSALTGAVRLELNSAYPGGMWNTLASGLTGNSYAWTITQAVTETARIRVVFESQTQFGDTSGGFAIVDPALAVTWPNGGQVLVIGDPYSLTFTRTGHPETVSLQLNRNYPTGTWETIAAGVSGSSVPWTASGILTFAARVRVVSDVYPGVENTGAGNFSILPTGITLISPLGSETFALGTNVRMKWARVNTGNVDVLLNRAYPSGTWETLAANLNSDSLDWTVSGLPSSACRIKVRATSDPGVSGQSAMNFEIELPTLTLVSPAAGDTFGLGVSNLIRWTRSTSATGNVRVELKRNYPSGTWTLLGTTLLDQLAWIADGAVTSTARIRIVSEVYPTVGDTLDFNLAIVNAALTVTAPVGGSIVVGQPVTIRWTRSNVGPGANVFLCRNYPGGTWVQLASSVTADEFVWTATAPRSGGACLRVLSTRIPALGDSSDPFSILEPSLTLLTLNGGAVGAGNSQEISWTRTDFAGPVDLDVNLDYPAGSWQSIAAGLSGDSYSWTVSSTLTNQARLRVRSQNPIVEDVTDANFSIVTPVLTVQYPNGGQIFMPGTPITISWTRTAVPGGVRVELNRTYPSGTWETIATDVMGNTAAYTMSGDFAHGRIRVSMMARPEVFDVSDSDFGTRLPDLYIVNPNGGDTLLLGQPYVIRWGRVNMPGLVKVELNRNYPGGTWEVLQVTTTADTLAWTISGAEATACRVRVTLIANPSITDISDGNFMIARQSVILATPVAGDSIAIGRPVTFTWATIGLPSTVNIYVKRNWPVGTWELVQLGATGGSYSWTASGTATDMARFRLLSATIPTIGDTTDGAVRIGTPQLDFVIPAVRDTFLVGENEVFSWIRRFAAGDIRVELSRSGETGPWEEIGVSSGSSQAWTVNGPPSTTARLRISLVDAAWVSRTTSFDCVIAQPALTVTSPAAGSINALGRALTIRWIRNAVSTPVDVFLRRIPGGDLETLASSVAGDSLVWITTTPAA